jgi:hypothetical protein
LHLSAKQHHQVGQLEHVHGEKHGAGDEHGHRALEPVGNGRGPAIVVRVAAAD